MGSNQPVPAPRRAPRLPVAALVSALLPGIRAVHAQVAAYALAWDEANRRAMEQSGPLWVALGDSTAQGIGASSYDQGYVGQLHRRLLALDPGWRVLNVSRSGARVADVLVDQLPVLEALSPTPQLVTCGVGANDLLRTPYARLLGQIRQLLDRLAPKSVVATLPQGIRPRRARPLNRLLAEEAPRRGLLVADVWAHTGPPWEGRLASDRFHPNERGYAQWAAAFAEALGLPEPDLEGTP